MHRKVTGYDAETQAVVGSVNLELARQLLE